MKGKLYIDGIDAYERYGIFVAKDGYPDLISFPAFKTLDSNSWPEEDGCETDLSDPVLGFSEITLNFYAVDYNKAMDLIVLVSDKSYHTFNFVEVGTVKSLRLVSETNKRIYVNMESFSLTFADDSPMDGYEYEEPVNDDLIKGTQDYEIDGRKLTDYGVFLLDGSDAEIVKSPAVKKNLLVDIPSHKGAIYDGELVVYEKKEVALKCLMVSSGTSAMWRNLNALVFDLIRLNTVLEEGDDDSGDAEYKTAERTFYVDGLVEEYPCYYNGLKATAFHVLSDGRIWLEFTLNLVFTQFTVDGQNFLLATEDGELVVTEDGEFYIDLNDYGD
jgi:hypothetical protein